MLVLTASPAFAQEGLIPVGVGVDDMHTAPSLVGITVTAGGSVTNFVDNYADSFTDIGGGWNVRVGVLTRFLISAELSYVGTAQQINAPGLDSNAVLLSNGAEVDLRLNILPGMFQPYVFGGVGYRHYNITNTATNTSALQNSDDLGMVPVGGGIMLRLGDVFILDARGTFRWAFDDQMLTNPADPGIGMSTWDATLNAGVEF
jgi:hypothetical protein